MSFRRAVTPLLKAVCPSVLRRWTLAYNFSIAAQDADLLERVVKLADSFGMRRADRTEPDDIPGTNPVALLKRAGHEHIARFLGRQGQAHPNLQDIWRWETALKANDIRVVSYTESQAAPTGNIYGFTMILDRA